MGVLKKSIEPCNLTEESIALLADQTRRAVGYEFGHKILVEKIGGEIRLADFFEPTYDLDEAGSIEIRSKHDFTITLPEHTPELRDRFTIAHELGHYVLHYLYLNQYLNRDIKTLKVARYGKGQSESEANWFAACFLMPEKEFKAKMKELSNYIAVADFFGVSSMAAYYRSKGLGISI